MPLQLDSYKYLYHDRPTSTAMAKRELDEDDYESDGGFVEDAPKSKKQKQKEVSGEVQKDDEGNQYWEVRRVYASHVSG